MFHQRHFTFCKQSTTILLYVLYTTFLKLYKLPANVFQLEYFSFSQLITVRSSQPRLIATTSPLFFYFCQPLSIRDLLNRCRIPIFTLPNYFRVASLSGQVRCRRVKADHAFDEVHKSFLIEKNNIFLLFTFSHVITTLRSAKHCHCRCDQHLNSVFLFWPDCWFLLHDGRD